VETWGAKLDREGSGEEEFLIVSLSAEAKVHSGWHSTRSKTIMGAAANASHGRYHSGRLAQMTSSTPSPPTWLQAAREQWNWRGQARPRFAAELRPGQTSVWDFPRPPRLAPEPREVRIVWCGLPVACSTRAVRRRTQLQLTKI